jgi:hypothetical protein
MEGIKGFVFGRGKKESEQKTSHVYLVCFVLVTDTELTNVSPTGETIIMGVPPADYFTHGINCVQKYRPPYPLGDASEAILKVSRLSPSDLELIRESAKPREDPPEDAVPRKKPR